MAKKPIKATDAFGFTAGIIGLVADVAGLGGLVIVSKAGQDSQIFLWIFLFLSLVYSLALVNFFTRKRLYAACSEQLRSCNRRLEVSKATTNLRINPDLREKYKYLNRVDSGTYSTTLLIGIPIIISFCAMAFYVDGASSTFDRSLDLFNLFIFSERLRYTCLSAVFYGVIFGLFVCALINKMVSSIFLALDQSYGELK